MLLLLVHGLYFEYQDYGERKSTFKEIYNYMLYPVVDMFTRGLQDRNGKEIVQILLIFMSTSDNLYFCLCLTCIIY